MTLFVNTLDMRQTVKMGKPMLVPNKRPKRKWFQPEKETQIETRPTQVYRKRKASVE